jgi:hypothetical protein
MAGTLTLTLKGFLLVLRTRRSLVFETLAFASAACRLSALLATPTPA